MLLREGPVQQNLGLCAHKTPVHLLIFKNKELSFPFFSIWWTQSEIMKHKLIHDH